MALIIGRQGYLGYALEATSGIAEPSPDVFLPITDCTLASVNEKYMDLSTRRTRYKNWDSISGKTWSEGEISMYADSINSGYLWRLALGQEVKSDVQASPNVDNHQFYPTASGNTCPTATMWGYGNEGQTCYQYKRVACDELVFELGTDGIGTMKATVLGEAGTAITAPTLTTTSGTLYTWTMADVKFGNSVAEARSASCTKINNITVTVNNNLISVWRTCGANVSEVIYGENEISVEYTTIFEDSTSRDIYMADTKRAMIIKLTGAGLGGVSEEMELVFPRITIEEKEIETGQADLVVLNAKCKALGGSPDGTFVVNLQNCKTAEYS